MPRTFDSRRVHDRRCLKRPIRGGFITECNHRALRHQAKSSPVTSIQWALFEAWKPKDGSVDIHCLLMVPEVAEKPTNCRSALTGGKKGRNLGSVWDSHDIATPRPLASHAHVTVAVVKKK